MEGRGRGAVRLGVEAGRVAGDAGLSLLVCLNWRSLASAAVALSAAVFHMRRPVAEI